MCDAIAVFLTKRNLLIKGIKAQKKAAASTGFIQAREASGSQFVLRAAKRRLIAVPGSEGPVPDLARQKAMGQGHFHQDGVETPL